jgi:16S rRNA C967 or C1407 C5-methylase (RsmB/RsmF family)
MEAIVVYFKEQFGEERWSTLFPALQTNIRHAILMNPYCDPEVIVDLLKGMKGTLIQVPWLSTTTAISSTSTLEGQQITSFPHPTRDVYNLWTYYCMDLASMIAVEALGVTPGARVLDLCAAPGGKSLNLLYRMYPPGARNPSGYLVVNEPNAARRNRLREVVYSYSPPNLHSMLSVTSWDGTRLGRYADRKFSHILIDAPCSSERHVIQDAQEVLKWTKSKTKTASKRQFQLLWNGLQELEHAGTLVYATCSISHQENDEVVKLVLTKWNRKRKQYRAKKDDRNKPSEEASASDSDNDDDFEVPWYARAKISIVRREWPLGEPTKYGWIVLPDKAEGWGPIYFCTFKVMWED